MNFYSGNKKYYSILIVATVITILPIWITKYPPLVDYPNHLARVYIESNYNNVEIFQKYLSFKKEPIPNLIFDVLVNLFYYITGDIYISGKIFITLSIVLIIYGCHKLVFNLREFSYLGLLGLYFSYNSGLLWGFMNYVFGLGLCLIYIAIWIKNKYVMNIRILILLIFMSYLSYLSHLSSFIFLNIVVFSISIFDYLFDRNRKKNIFAYLSGCIITLLPILLMIYFMNKSGKIGKMFWNSFTGKIINIAGSASLYNYQLDAIVVMLIICIIISISYFLQKGIITCDVNFSVLFAAIILWIAYILCPKGIFTGSAADARFIPIATIMTIVSIKINLKKQFQKINVILAICIVLILGIRLWQVKHYWGIISNNIETQVQYFDLLDEENIVTPIIIMPQEYTENKLERPLYHVIQYSTIEKHNLCTSLFVLKGQNILNFRSELNIPNYQLNENSNFKKLDLVKIFNITKYFWTYAETKDIENILVDKSKLLLNQKKVKIYEMVN